MNGLGYRILVVSERPALVQAVSSLLQLAIGEDAEMVAYERMEAALQEADLESFDLLLLEADDRVEDRLKRLGNSYYNASVVAITESADHELGLACIGAGAHDYITLEELSPGSLFRTLRFAVERRKVQQALIRSQAQLSQAQKMEAIGRMASGLAHDFRQYIQVIVGNSKVLQRLSKDDETISQLVLDIAQAGFGASELVGQVLDFAREGPVEMKEIELNQALLAKKAMVESFGKGMEMRIEPHPSALPIDGDPVQLGQIILNLAINAVDASDRNGMVVVRTRHLALQRTYTDPSVSLERGSYAVLDVMDTGSGIPEDVREKIFDPFFTTKPRGKGTGLGLSTVYTLARGMKGQIAFWTELGVGTTFSLFLPCKIPLEFTRLKPLHQRVGMVTSDTTERTLLRAELKKLGCRVREFDTLAKGLAWLKKHKDRCLLVDRRVAGDLSELCSNCILLTALCVKVDNPEFEVLNRPYSIDRLASVCRQFASAPSLH